MTDKKQPEALRRAGEYPPMVGPLAVLPEHHKDIVRAYADATCAMRAQAAPVAQGDALPREDFAWLVVQEACETEPADEDDPECIRILRRDLKSAVLAAFLRHDAAHPAAPVAQGDAEDTASTGFFLQLPQRPKPEAPAGTVGLDWDAYSGAQMLAYGRDCSNAARAQANEGGATMTRLEKAAKQALEALEDVVKAHGYVGGTPVEAIVALREALEQPSQDAEDAARLDWMIEQRAYVVSDPDACPGYWLQYARPDGSTWVQCGEHPTPRAAIDAARARAQAKEGTIHE